MSDQKKVILVDGDVAVERLLIHPEADRGNALDAIWVYAAGDDVHTQGLPGGAARLADLLERAATAALETSDVTVRGPRLGPDALVDSDPPSVTQMYGLVTRVPKSLEVKTPSVWRMREYWGLHRVDDRRPPIAPDVSGPVDLLVLHDGGLDYRRRREAWEPLLALDPAAVVLAAGSPFDDDPLLEALLERNADRLTVVAPVMELRRGGAAIDYPLSWERLAEDVDRSIRGGRLGAAARVVVQIAFAGAVVVERDGPTTLVFDPYEQEESAGLPGYMLGFVLGHTVAQALAALSGGDVVDWARRGVRAVRALQQTGFVERDGPERVVLEFPTEAVLAALAGGSDHLTSVEYPRPGGPVSILAATLGEQALLDAAVELALSGPEGLPAGIPIETIGKWASVDRVEIEALRAVRQIMREYVQLYRRNVRLPRPLSVAVFGPPGAGKSFAVKEIARQLLPGTVRMLEFNLSQFEGQHDFSMATLQIRDAVLEQQLPLVFWDEFDTALDGQPLGWLRHFLAPMQDGTFHEGGAFHPLGPAIFVFAGGTAASLEDFQRSDDPRADREAKKPDFVSRLRGFVDILGPNRTGSDDRAYLLRRALLLHSLILRKAPQLAARRRGVVRLRVAPDVLRAFLLVDHFRHGARSMEALLDMSALAGKLQFERSSLPPRSLLALHVDTEQFVSFVEQTGA